MKGRQKKQQNNPLLKRVPRELRKDLGKYIALFLFMSMMIGLVSGFLVADGSMIRAYKDSFTKFNIEDGHFNCDLKLTKTAVRNIEDEDVRLYEMFYKDKTATWKGEQKTVRLYRPRKEVNGVDVMEGRLPEKNGEIAVDRLFAENNGMAIGDRIKIEGQKLTVTGLVALSDYSALFKNNSDMMFNASAFTVAIVTKAQFASFSTAGLVYCYAWRYEDRGMTDDEAKSRADDLMEVVYDNSMLGADTSWSPMVWNMLMTADAFDDGNDHMIETETPLQEFIARQDNQAITFTGEDMGSDKIMFEWFLYIVTVVLAFAFAITTRSTIEQEARVIGTLAASGYTRRELITHYILLPVVVTLIAALVGNILGYTVLKYIMADMYYHSYSLPTYVTIWNGDAFVKTTLIPCALVAGTELLMIGRSLSLPPLKFLRRDLKRGKQGRAVKLPRLNFRTRFYLRVMLQNRSTYLLLFAGIFLSSVIFLFGSLFLPLLDQFKSQILDSEFCQYQYVLKDKAETKIPGAEKYAVMTLENERGEKITVYGVDKESRYLDMQKLAGLDGGQALFSNGYYEKYKIRDGDPIVLGEEFTSKKYAITAEGTYQYPASLCIFMNIDQFREMFDLDDDYYNGYFSDEELTDIRESDLATVITEEDLLTTSNQLEDSMGGAFTLFLIFSIIMFVLMIFLLAKLVTERNAYAISMLKILGYTNREAGSLYQSATGIVVVISLVLSGFLGLRMIRVIYQLLMQSFNGYMTFYAAPWGIPVLVGTGIACYGLVSMILMRRIRKIPMTHALKDGDSL